MEEEQKDNQTIDNLVDHLKPLVEHMKHIHDMAVVAYTPLVDDLCTRKATQNEVEWMLDWCIPTPLLSTSWSIERSMTRKVTCYASTNFSYPSPPAQT